MCQIRYESNVNVKGAHAVYFSNTCYLLHHKSKHMIPRTDFHCITTLEACSSV